MTKILLLIALSFCSAVHLQHTNGFIQYGAQIDPYYQERPINEKRNDEINETREKEIDSNSGRDRRTLYEILRPNFPGDFLQYQDLKFNTRYQDRSPINRLLQEQPAVYTQNATNIIEMMEKRNFSPWGGKRNVNPVAKVSTWKRNDEADLPKRVRFSPWGGKRGNHQVFIPIGKSRRAIFSQFYPEVAKIISRLSNNPRDISVNGIKRNLVKSFTGAQTPEINGISYNTLLEDIINAYRTGQIFSDKRISQGRQINMKRKKRSQVIVSQLWTPSAEDIKDHTLNSIIQTMEKLLKEERQKQRHLF